MSFSFYGTGTAVVFLTIVLFSAMITAVLSFILMIIFSKWEGMANRSLNCAAFCLIIAICSGSLIAIIKAVSPKYFQNRTKIELTKDGFKTTVIPRESSAVP